MSPLAIEAIHGVEDQQDLWASTLLSHRTAAKFLASERQKIPIMEPVAGQAQDPLYYDDVVFTFPAA